MKWNGSKIIDCHLFLKKSIKNNKKMTKIENEYFNFLKKTFYQIFIKL